MNEIRTSIVNISTNLHPDGVQQALTDTTDSGNFADGKVAHEVPNRLGRMGQVKLTVGLILYREMSLY